MKAQRESLVRRLAVTVLVLILAVAAWRFRGARPSRNFMASGSADVAPADTQEQSRQGQPQTHAGVLVPTSPFLLELGATMESIRTLPESAEQEERLEALGNGIAIRDVPAALEFLLKSGGLEMNQDLGLRLLRRWTASEPRMTADWVSRMSAEPARREAIVGVAVVWSGQSVPDAADWARQLPDDEERQRAVQTIAYEALRTEPLTAINLARELPADQAQEDLILHAVRQWAAATAEPAVEWAQQMPEGPMRDRVLAAIATEWGETDPAAAATLAVKALSQGKPQADAVVGIVQRWVQKQPEEAAAWVVEFPEGTLRNAAVENLVKLWADQNLEQAGKWLAGLGTGALRDSAVEAYISKITPTFPAVAAAWAEQIQAEDARNRQMEAVAEGWVAKDGGAARVWIAQTPLPEQTKTRLLALSKQ